MNYFQKFEDIIAWKKARELTKEVYQLTRGSSFDKDYGLTSQLQRSAVSIMSNIAEGYERDSKAEFHRFLLIAKGSCAEIRSLLYVAHDAEKLPKEKFERLLSQAEEIARIIGGLRSSVRLQRDHQGFST